MAILIKMAKRNFDVAVIGAGPAGMMAAITAARLGASVALLERNESPGKKLLLTGNGRCNITNAEFDLRKLVANYGQNGPFLFHAFSIFGPNEVMAFFDTAGVATVIEDKQRVFPRSMKSQDVLDALARNLAESGVELFFNAKVTEIGKKDGLAGPVITAAAEIAAQNYIIATGGKSYVGTGSTGDGYEWAHRLGHRIEKLAPALVPVMAKETWGKETCRCWFGKRGHHRQTPGSKNHIIGRRSFIYAFWLERPGYFGYQRPRRRSCRHRRNADRARYYAAAES